MADEGQKNPFFNPEGMPGAHLSPIQFSRIQRSGAEIAREIETLINRAAFQGPEAFEEQLEAYARAHPNEVAWYAQHLEDRLKLMHMLIIQTGIRQLGELFNRDDENESDTEERKG